MRINLNGEQLFYTLENERCLGEVLGSLEAACRREHSTIVNIVVDGKVIEPNALDTVFMMPVDADVTVELGTLSGAEIRAYMKKIAQELLSIAESFEQIAVLMQTGKDREALSILGAFSYKLNDLYRSLLLYDITELPEDIQIEEKPLTEYQKEITELLQDILTSIEEHDIIQVGDLAEYELAPLVKTLVNGVSSFLL